jgi:rhodanese-related sulfurtransferase
MPPVPELTPTEFRDRWPQGSSDVVLLDVREQDELAVAAVEEAVHIPMGEIPARVRELDRDRPLVVMCHSGGRSRRVAEFLRANGFEHVFNLRGGIDSWSTELDARVPRY